MLVLRLPKFHVQYGNDFGIIAYNSVIAVLEDGRVRVVVDSHNQFCSANAYHVVECTPNRNREVQLRPTDRPVNPT